MEEVKIMKRKKFQGRDLARAEKMSNVVPAIRLTDDARARCVEWIFVRQKFLFVHIQPPVRRKGYAVARIVGGHGAVEGINTGFDDGLNILKMSHTQKMAWFFVGELAHHDVEHAGHCGLVVAEFSADTESVKGEARDKLRALHSQLFVSSSLYDAVERLFVRVVF